jgi:hypothetical protein
MIVLLIIVTIIVNVGVYTTVVVWAVFDLVAILLEL